MYIYYINFASKIDQCLAFNKDVHLIKLQGRFTGIIVLSETSK